MAGVIMLLSTCLCGSAGLTSSSKNIDYTPDITSDAYWNSHNICAVQIVDVTKDHQNVPYITYRVTTELSGPMTQQTGTIKLADLWFGVGEEAPTNLKTGDRLILYYPAEGPSRAAVTILDSTGNQLLDTLRHIARLRNQPDMQAVMSDVFGDDSIVSLYCLKRLLSHPAPKANADYITRLLAFRDDDKRGSRQRILADKLADELAGKPIDSASEYTWAAKSLMTTTEEDWRQTQPFVDRLLEFESRRKESVDLLTNLVLDSNANQATRIAAYSVFTNPQMFKFEKPDLESERIFQTCRQMLKARDPIIRAAGAALLHNISVQISPAYKTTYIEQSRAAIQEAINVEHNETTKQQMSQYLTLLSK